MSAHKIVVMENQRLLKIKKHRLLCLMHTKHILHIREEALFYFTLFWQYPLIPSRTRLLKKQQQKIGYETPLTLKVGV